MEGVWIDVKRAIANWKKNQGRHSTTWNANNKRRWGYFIRVKNSKEIAVKYAKRALYINFAGNDNIILCELLDTITPPTTRFKQGTTPYIFCPWPRCNKQTTFDANGAAIISRSTADEHFPRQSTQNVPAGVPGLLSVRLSSRRNTVRKPNNKAVIENVEDGENESNCDMNIEPPRKNSRIYED
ncbi:Oidioi.mRNA.OKI2018_I69.chr2.g4867.t1.cds [Oikopleura dioica]|uniref:Oidioi.mRNA.OKI2018_I69.chr2.g4867.t1.cds n=1 Tax=Oikopleura dioica TaxID=34765 RepID=A0ABN7T1Z6_OIKDI|nr:Oidioi.mRNA.OKI2018_I69.chr2.g4867.t1.cds [Oikopleura dioica]